MNGITLRVFLMYALSVYTIFLGLIFLLLSWTHFQFLIFVGVLLSSAAKATEKYNDLQQQPALTSQKVPGTQPDKTPNLNEEDDLHHEQMSAPKQTPQSSTKPNPSKESE